MTHLLNRPISVYSIPPEILSNLSVRSIQAQTNDESSLVVKPDETSAVVSSRNHGSLSCQACPGASFDTMEDQRSHFKSDWHRYNVKAKLTGRAVTEEEWGNLVEGQLKTQICQEFRLCVIKQAFALLYDLVFDPSNLA